MTPVPGPIATGVLRSVLAVAGGFAFTTALAGLGAAGLARTLPLAASDAALLACMLGFIVYLLVLLWAFAEPRLGRVGLVLAGGGTAAYLLARTLAPASSLGG